MLRFDEKRKLRRVLFSWPTAGALLVLMVLLSPAIWQMWQKERVTAERLSKSLRELAHLQEREMKLQGEIVRLGTERGQEEEVRSRYEVARPGEKVIIVVDAPTEAQEAAAQSSSWWARVLEWFGL